jgi:hypothetical protein
VALALRTKALACAAAENKRRAALYQMFNLPPPVLGHDGSSSLSVQIFRWGLDETLRGRQKTCGWAWSSGSEHTKTCRPRPTGLTTKCSIPVKRDADATRPVKSTRRISVLLFGRMREIKLSVLVPAVFAWNVVVATVAWFVVGLFMR